MKKTIILISVSLFGFVGCAKNAEVTWHKLCDDKTNKASLDFTVPLYSEPNVKSAVLEYVPVGTVVKVSGHRNHNVWDPKYFIKVQTLTQNGYMSPKCLVVNQDPEQSVWRYSKNLVKDYVYFYSPEDKEHYPRGYEYGSLKSLPKDKIPLSELSKGLEEAPFIHKTPLKQN
ncbi:lipoprotein [Leptospira ryugenii]|uniref:Lipoprotein n=1 Tax=Leptospira ryugenii TaxID=1917863 RepID=A0A2P2DY28_9LEPT|nr:SH3 domain-containing protein [Leptospira ryugenii]GBF49544.1 lipoprotein [Leptospira ryugenii]